MTQIVDMLASLLPLLYALAGLNYAILFFRGSSFARRTVTPSLVVIVLLHLAVIGARSAQYRRCPLADFTEILSLLALSVALVYLVLEAQQKNPYTGMFILFLVTPLSALSALLVPRAGLPSPLLKTAWFGFHTTLALLGYAAFAVSAVYAFMFLLLNHALKRRSFGLVFDRLPPLEVLARMNLGAAMIGFGALTLAMAIGTIWGAREIHDFWRDPKLHLTLLVWALYGTGLVLRYRFRWPNRPLAILFLTGFLVAIVSVWMLQTVLHTFHVFATGGAA